jgi:hypothetical protein
LLWVVATISSDLVLLAVGRLPNPNSAFSWTTLFFAKIIGIAMALFYLVHLIKNERVPLKKKVVWIILIILIGPISMPIYWHHYLWVDNDAAQK